MLSRLYQSGVSPMKTSRTAMMANSFSNGSSDRHQPLSPRASTEAVECPKCKKRSIVRRSPNLFSCLNCNFQKELPPVAPGSIATNLSSSLGSHTRAQRMMQNNLLLSSDPNRMSDSRLHTITGEDIGESDRLQPLVFAACAVIFGILFL